MYKRILVPVDGSATSLLGLEEAIKLDKTSGATLRIVHVVNEFLMDPGYVPALYYDRVIDSLRETGKKVISEVEAIARKHAVQFESAVPLKPRSQKAARATASGSSPALRVTYQPAASVLASLR